MSSIVEVEHTSLSFVQLFVRKKIVPPLNCLQQRLWIQRHALLRLCFRALHWVTIQMLCVSMDEEIPEVSENVVKAITGQTPSSQDKSKTICRAHHR